MKVNLPSDVKTRLNQIAFRAGTAHGEKLKITLRAECQRRFSAGENFAEVFAYLDDIAAQNLSAG